MKYCPDCDMEFIDSVQTCTDCGKILVDKDKYFEGKAAREAEEEKAEEERRREMLESMTEEEKEAMKEAMEEAEQQTRGRHRGAIPEPTVYVTRAERYEDLKSSASAFWIVGAALIILAVASWAGILPVNIILKLMFTVLAAVSLFIAWKTGEDAKTVKGQIKEETEVTEQLIKWFLENYTPEQIDEIVTRENGELQDEILALKRIALIQDIYVTQYDLADQGYVDALAEEVYSQLFEEDEEDDFEEEEDFGEEDEAAEEDGSAEGDGSAEDEQEASGEKAEKKEEGAGADNASEKAAADDAAETESGDDASADNESGDDASASDDSTGSDEN